MTQATFLDRPTAPYQRTSETSRTGADAATEHAGRQCQTILNYVRECGKFGATNHEIAQATGIPLAAVCARRNSLVNRKLLVVDGERMGPAGIPNAVVKVNQ